MPFSQKLVHIARRLLIGLAGFATLIALAIVVENWRGDRAWQAVEKHHAAIGDPLDVLPPPPPEVPDEKNFFCTPALASLINKKDVRFNGLGLSATQSREDGSVYLDLTRVAKDIAKYRKLPEPTKEGTASFLQTIFAPIDSTLSELRQAAIERPFSQIRRPEKLTVTNLFSVQNIEFMTAINLSNALILHACINRAKNKMDDAFAETLAALKLGRGFIDSSHGALELLVGLVILSNAAQQPLMEGLQQHGWSEAQLIEFQHQIERCQFVESLKRALICERNFAANLDLRQPSRDIRPLSRPWWANFHGWFQQTKRVNTIEADARIELLSSHATPQFREKLALMQRVPRQRPWNPYRWLARMTQSNTDAIIRDYVIDASITSFAQTACALERYWLAHGNYPEGLAELVPIYIDKVPLALIDGQPLHYRRTDNGKFVLYSAGRDGIDHGGDRSVDWVWPN
jgi:hypothetical protein